MNTRRSWSAQADVPSNPRAGRSGIAPAPPQDEPHDDLMDARFDARGRLVPGGASASGPGGRRRPTVDPEDLQRAVEALARRVDGMPSRRAPRPAAPALTGKTRTCRRNLTDCAAKYAQLRNQ